MMASISNQYLQENTADIHFTFDFSNEKVPAHKSVLAAGSDVFKKMFNDAWNTGDHVYLSGKQPDIFKKFLEFFYHCETDLDSHTIMHVMEYLHEYQMNDSLTFCANFWIRNCHIDDICLAYAWAIHLEMDEFQQLCERKISIDCAEIFKTDAFRASPFYVIDRIVSLHTLICDENQILTAILEWARFRCKQDMNDSNIAQNVYNQLKNGADNLLYKIRYGSMSVKDFVAQMNLNGGLFGHFDEYENVLRLLAGADNLKTGKFLTNPRKIQIWPSDLSEINLTFPKNQIVPQMWGMPNFVMHIHVNQTILWYEFVMVNIKTDLTHEFEYEMIIGETSLSTNVYIETINGINPNVKFTRPVLLKSNTTYAIHFDFSKVQHWDYSDEVPFSKQNFHCEDVIINAFAKLNGCLIKKIKFTTLDSFLTL